MYHVMGPGKENKQPLNSRGLLAAASQPQLWIPCLENWKLGSDDCTGFGSPSVTSMLFRYSCANSISESYEGNFGWAKCSYKICLLLSHRHNSKEFLTRKQHIALPWITDFFSRILELTVVLTWEPGYFFTVCGTEMPTEPVFKPNLI